MKPQTLSRTFPKSVPAICRSNDPLTDPNAATDCFWLGLMYTGKASFEVDGHRLDAIAPCFLCFDDRHPPKLISKKGVRCDSIYFDPTFININMTTERVHGENYAKVAAEYDLFILKPFTDSGRFAFPLFEDCLGSAKRMFGGIERELLQQDDWYWSCRSRSFFMELIFLLESAYSYALRAEEDGGLPSAHNLHLQKAILYIGSHFCENMTLSDIVHAAGINHTTLTQLFKDELGMTPMAYLWHHRIQIAAKQLEFTSLPTKDISARCGFKTVQHFSRKFQQAMGTPPSTFRAEKLRTRMTGFGQPPERETAAGKLH